MSDIKDHTLPDQDLGFQENPLYGFNVESIPEYCPPSVPPDPLVTTQPTNPPEGGEAPSQHDNIELNHQASPAGSFSHNVTVVQTGSAPLVVGIAPPDYCCLAWFACCCCLPIGVVAIISSNTARDAINRGDLVIANTYSKLARKYSFIGIGLGISSFVIVTIVIPILLFVVVGITEKSTAHY